MKIQIRRHSRKIAAAIMVAVLFTAPLIGPPANGRGVAAKGEPMVKVAASVENFALDADISSLSGGTLSIAGAKGESEGGQVIVRPVSDVKAFDARMSGNLTKGADVIEASNIAVYAEVYAFCARIRRGRRFARGLVSRRADPAGIFGGAGREIQSRRTKTRRFLSTLKSRVTPSPAYIPASLRSYWTGTRRRCPFR